MHDPETHLIPLVLIAARHGTAVKIFGTDYDTPDGTCVRDYVHVVDIADAHVRALDHLFEGGESRAFNLANAHGHSVKEVIAAAERVVGILSRIEWRRVGRAILPGWSAIPNGRAKRSDGRQADPPWKFRSPMPGIGCGCRLGRRRGPPVSGRGACHTLRMTSWAIS